jgi:bifunctional ADP-heptose synthase (sugar kinase/adenylyltransferase)
MLTTVEDTIIASTLRPDRGSDAVILSDYAKGVLMPPSC